MSKNLLDTCVTALVFYICGYAISSNANGGIVGHGKMFNIGFNNDDYLRWFFEYSLCSTCTTIVSGMMAERSFVDTYIVYTVFMTAVVYPISSSWINGNGWLKHMGFHDAAGCGYIHMLGGLSGFVGTILLGPRHGIYEKNGLN